MAHSLQYFFQKTQKRYRLELLAGREGMSSPVSWVYLMEDIPNTDFLRGGELVITTGITMTGEEKLLDFARALKERHAAGLLINTGRFITAVPESLLHFCDTSRLPLFTMPEDAPVADLMENYCNEMIQKKHTDEQVQEILHQHLFSGGVQIQHQQLLTRHGFPEHADYRILASREKIPCQGICFHENDVHYALLREQDPLPHDNPSPIGLAGVKRLSDLSLGRKHAYQALLVGSIGRKPLTDYNRIGLYQTVFAIQDKTALRQLSLPLLNPLREYDSEHGTDYLELTRLYLDLDCDIEKVAEKSAAGLSAIQYRIEKIKKLLNTDFSSPEECCQYQIAFYIYDVLSITGNV